MGELLLNLYGRVIGPYSRKWTNFHPGLNLDYVSLIFNIGLYCNRLGPGLAQDFK